MSDTDRGPNPSPPRETRHTKGNGLTYPVRDQYDERNVVGNENKKKDALRAFHARPRVERVTPRNHLPERLTDCGCGPTAIEPILGSIHPTIHVGMNFQDEKCQMRIKIPTHREKPATPKRKWLEISCQIKTISRTSLGTRIKSKTLLEPPRLDPESNGQPHGIVFPDVLQIVGAVPPPSSRY
jgi:hypothetical protein